MIRKLFIPNVIGTYHVTSQYVFGFEISKNVVRASYITLHGYDIRLLNFFDEAIEPTTEATVHEKNTANAIARILNQEKQYTRIYSSISSSYATLKKISLPFTSYEKIAMVIPYEIEPALPFSLEKAIVDFVITKKQPEKNQAEVLVAAVQKQTIIQQLQLFEMADASVDGITIDMIDLYHLYSSIPCYAESKKITVLLNMGWYKTDIVYIKNQQLHMIRSLPRSLFDLIKEISSSFNIKPKEFMNYMMRFGLDNPSDLQYTKAIKRVMKLFWHDIVFTLNSFIAQNSKRSAIEKIILVGKGAAIKGMMEHATNQLSIPCELMKINELIYDKQISLEYKNGIPYPNIISLGTAISSTFPFNLRQKEFNPVQTNETIIQLATTGVLSFLLIIIFFIFSMFQTSKLRTALTNSAQQTVRQLQNALGDKITPTGKNPVKRLESAVGDASAVVAEKEKMWSAFAGPAQVTFLQYLYELFTGLDREGLGLSIEKFAINDAVLSLKGSVRGYRELELLNRHLTELPLFRGIIRGSMQEPIFDIDIQLKQTEEM